MAKKMTDAEKAEAAKKRAAKRAEAEADAAGNNENPEDGSGAGHAAGAGDEGEAGAAPEGKPAPAAKSKAKAKANTAAVVTVKTVRGVNSRWREGYGFGPEPREIPLADLSEDQLEALDADPSLVVLLEG